MRESMEILSDPQMMRRVRMGRHAVAAADLVELDELAGAAPTPGQWRVVLTGPVARALAQLDPEPAAAVHEMLAALGTNPAEQGRALGMGLAGLRALRGASHRVLYAVHEGQRLVTVISLDDR
jgi:mRNA-degrading endonuclease RelE of RelBE toxin-antitoxin system